WKHKYQSGFVTYSIGARYEKGDFLIKNITIESKIVTHRWPQIHRLQYKIQNHNDLISFAQIDIIDSDDPHEVHINTHSDCYDLSIESPKRIRGFLTIYHKARENYHHLARRFPPYLPSFFHSNHHEQKI
ncbi:CLUMA_CG002404, isoform A, partial [Clunio marinus]